jgi:hypothetical protein
MHPRLKVYQSQSEINKQQKKEKKRKKKNPLET